VDKAESVSALMGQYRRLGNAALAAAVLLVWGMLWRWREWRRGSLILAPSLLGMLAGLALAGAGLTLFKTIALVLVLGFGVDYTVFLAAAEDPAPALLGVLLAGFATLLSFGLLAFSHTPALRGFGLTLGLGLLVAVLSAPMALPRKEPT
jgi:predicted exporter